MTFGALSEKEAEVVEVMRGESVRLVKEDVICDVEVDAASLTLGVIALECFENTKLRAVRIDWRPYFKLSRSAPRDHCISPW